MKKKTKLFISSVSMAVVLSTSYALDNGNAIFNPQTGDVHIPAIEVNGRIEFINVKIRLDSNGMFRFVSTDYPAPTITPSEIAFPLSGNINFISQEYLGIFMLNNGSMWEIKGAPRYASVGSGVQNFTIYQGTDSLNSPYHGKKTDHFMLVQGNPATFFVQQVSDFANYISDAVVFNSQVYGGIFKLSNGSMWEIKGSPRYASLGEGQKSIKIYRGTNSLAQPFYGQKSDYFMLVDENPATFFVSPI